MYKFNIISCFAVLIIFIFIVLFLPTDKKAEEFENRAMETMPKLSLDNLISGEFFTRLENFLLDNVAFRTSWLTFSNIAENSYGLNFVSGATMVDFGNADLGIGLIPIESAEHNLIGRPVSIPFSIDIFENENAILYLRFIENEQLARRYAEVINAHREALPDDIRMFSMLAPVKVEFMDERYAAVNSSQLGTIEFINNLLDNNIITIDAHTPLYKNRDLYTFFRTDHHWTMLGAYFAYLAFAETAGFEPITIENYTEYKIEGFIGSLAVGTRNRNILNHPDTIYFYRLDYELDMFILPYDLSDISYHVFFGGDHAFFYFTTSNKNGRNLVVVKDSFANALVPWIAPHYERIVMIDPRQFTGSVSEVVSQLENVDVLFINYLPATTMESIIEQTYEVR